MRDVLDQSLVRGAVVVEQEGRRVEVQVLDLDRLGVEVERIKVVGRGAPLEAVARRLPEALQSLPERMVPVEVDPGLGGAILRTDPRDLRGRQFFEARSDGKSVELERMQGTAEGREKRGFTLTREQLGRIVEGIGEVLDPT
jgi:hypothetical protein